MAPQATTAPSGHVEKKSLIMLCAVPNCLYKAQYTMGFEVHGSRRWGKVCATHDKFFARKNLAAQGLPIEEIRAIEKDILLAEKEME